MHLTGYNSFPTQHNPRIKPHVSNGHFLSGFTQRLYPSGFLHLSNRSQAVIPGGYIRWGEPVVTRAHGAGCGNEVRSGYNRLQSKRCICTHYVTFVDLNFSGYIRSSVIHT